MGCSNIQQTDRISRVSKFKAIGPMCERCGSSTRMEHTKLCNNCTLLCDAWDACLIKSQLPCSSKFILGEVNCVVTCALADTNLCRWSSNHPGDYIVVVRFAYKCRKGSEGRQAHATSPWLLVELVGVRTLAY
jgi:hypothetical protein